DAKMGVVAGFYGVTHPTAAAAFRGTELYIERDKLPEPDDDEIYHADIIGMAAQRSDGSDVGEVIAMQNFGAGDLLEIRLAGNKRTEFVPFDDQFVPEIDFDARCVTVVMPDDTAEAEGD
ncbi:MAG: ribosome maturation factor RimM, partial [Pseudomonadota bacterium]